VYRQLEGSAKGLSTERLCTGKEDRCFLFTHCWVAQRWRLKAGGDKHTTHSRLHFASINQLTRCQAVQSKLTLIGTFVYFARLKHQSHCNVQHIRKEQMMVQVIDTLLKI